MSGTKLKRGWAAHVISWAIVLIVFAACLFAEHTKAHAVLFYIGIGLLNCLIIAYVVKLFSMLMPSKKLPLLAFYAFILEGFLHIYLFCVLFPCFFKKLECRGRGTPLLMVHGYLHVAPVWIYHINRLKKAGYGPIYALNLGSPFSSIEKHAGKLAKKIKEIEQETGLNKLILIGHSMGGLVSCYYATKIAQPGTVPQVITLGAPLGGTKVATIGIGKCAKEMKMHSEFTKRLVRNILNEKNVEFYHIGSKSDQLVIPYSSCFVVDNKERHLLLEGIGHVGLLFSKEASQQIGNWLQQD